jgi:hypothetical protein
MEAQSTVAHVSRQDDGDRRVPPQGRTIAGTALENAPKHSASSISAVGLLSTSGLSRMWRTVRPYDHENKILQLDLVERDRAIPLILGDVIEKAPFVIALGVVEASLLEAITQLPDF